MTINENPNPESAISLLQNWINRGLFVSNDPASRDVSGGSLDKVARGMAAIASVDAHEELVRVVNPAHVTFPTPHTASLPSRAIVIMDNSLPEVKHASFGSSGEFKHKAIVLTVDPHNHNNVELNLVLPVNGVNVAPESYLVVTVRLTRTLSAILWEPFLRENGPLKASLGLAPYEEAWTYNVSNGINYIDRLLGEGRTALLRECLPDLGDYLNTVADKLRNPYPTGPTERK